MTYWVDSLAALLLLCGGMLSALDSFLETQYETAPLVAGLALLLINHGRRQPLRYLYLVLLLLLLRIVLHGDERFLSAEITLSDYALIVLGFAASYQLPQSFWRLLLPVLAIFIPLAALLSYQIRPQAEALEAFQAGTLSVNQTSFLLGACLILSLTFLWNSVTAQRPIRLRSVLTISWLAISLVILGLVIRTASRSGLGLPFLAFGFMLILAYWSLLKQKLIQMVRRLDKLVQSLAPQASSRVVGLAWMLGGIGLLGAVLAAGAKKIYSDPENTISDLHRLHLLRCYFGTLLTGNNRLVHGMGYTNASQTICKNIGLIKGSSHAHNIFAQIAADNGLFAMITVALFASWFLLRAMKQARDINHPIIFASSTLFVYLVFFLQIEGGWGKVSFLQVLIGLSFGALTMEPPVYAINPCDLDSNEARSRNVADRSFNSS